MSEKIKERFEKQMGKEGNPLGELYSRKQVNKHIVEAYDRTIAGVKLQVWREAEDEEEKDKKHPRGRNWVLEAEKTYTDLASSTKRALTEEEIELIKKAQKTMKQEYKDLNTIKKVESFIKNN